MDKILEITKAYASNAINEETALILRPKKGYEVTPTRVSTSEDIFIMYDILYKNNRDKIQSICNFKNFNIESKDIKSVYDSSPLKLLILCAKLIKSGVLESKEHTYLVFLLSNVVGHNFTARKDVFYLYNLLFKDEDEDELPLFTVYTSPSFEKILEIGKKYIRKKLYIYPEIPPQKRKNFKGTIASYDIFDIYIEEVILVFIDLTFFGKGDNACAITEKGIYWANSLLGKWVTADFVDWQEFFSFPLVLEDDEYFITRIGYSKNLPSSDSNIKEEDIYHIMKDFHDLAITHHLSKQKDEEDEVVPDIDIKTALNHPDKTLEDIIAKTFLYASPAHALYSHLINNTPEKTEDDVFLNRLYSISNKYELEKIIMDSENTFLNLLMATIQSSRKDIVEIIGDDIGEVFTYTENDINGLKREIQNYRNIVFPKIHEIYNSSQQLKYFSSQSSNNRASLALASGKLMSGTVSMVAGNPMGALALFAGIKDIENNDKQKTGKKSQEEVLLEDWAGVYSIFYGRYLEEYYNNFKALSYKIAGQYITNYELSEQLAVQHNNAGVYTEYLKSELMNMVENKEYISTRNKLNTIEEMQKNLGRSSMGFSNFLPNGMGGLSVLGSNGTYSNYVPNGHGGFNSFGANGMSSINSDGHEGYSTSNGGGFFGHFTSNGHDGFNEFDSDGTTSVNQNGHGGYNVSGSDGSYSNMSSNGHDGYSDYDTSGGFDFGDS